MAALRAILKVKSMIFLLLLKKIVVKWTVVAAAVLPLAATSNVVAVRCGLFHVHLLLIDLIELLALQILIAIADSIVALRLIAVASVTAVSEIIVIRFADVQRVAVGLSCDFLERCQTL